MIKPEDWFSETPASSTVEPTEDEIVAAICGQCSPEAQIRILDTIRNNEELFLEFSEILLELDGDELKRHPKRAIVDLRRSAIERQQRLTSDKE